MHATVLRLAIFVEPSLLFFFLGVVEGAGGLGGLRGLGFDIIPFSDLLGGPLGLLAHSDIFGAILRYISLCVYIGKNLPI